MPRPIFFTGTGTDIGKTHILCALLKAARSAGETCRVLKPVLSGFDTSKVPASDTARLLTANGVTLDAASIKAATPWRFKAPLSPDMAARREGRDLLLRPVANWCLDQIHPSQPTIIEGAGGLMSPIAADGLNLDMIRELDAYPVLVAGNYLGTISHILTALRALDGRSTVIINPHLEGPVAPEETLETLKRFAPRTQFLIYDADNPASLLPILTYSKNDAF
ncbi:MAG: dethiobiotin synthase [Alphaproteobacteria bacterium]|nr:dethiobiotin synthase [Alphaproteobacteria bacterium]